MSLRIDFLRHFILLAEEKSFSNVADKILITQSALSQQIEHLENYFKCNLIDRSTRTFKLTKQGEILLKYSKDIVSLFDKSQKEIFNLSKELVGTISIAASTIPGNHILPKFIADFKNKYANVTINIWIKNSKQSLIDLKKKHVEFAAIGSFIKEDREKFEYFPIFTENLVFICALDHDLVRINKGKVLFEDLIKYPYISREDGSGTKQFAMENLKKYDKLNQLLEMTSNESIISAVSKSNDISIISEMSAKKAEDAKLIKIINISNIPLLRRKLFFVKNKEIRLNKVAIKFWNFIYDNRD